MAPELGFEKASNIWPFIVTAGAKVKVHGDEGMEWRFEMKRGVNFFRGTPSIKFVAIRNIRLRTISNTLLDFVGTFVWGRRATAGSL